MVEGRVTANSPKKVVALISSPTETCKSINPILLATARVHAHADRGYIQVVRVLNDQGAQSSFITEDQRLRLKRRTVRVPISGVGTNKLFVCKGKLHSPSHPISIQLSLV